MTEKSSTISEKQPETFGYLEVPEGGWSEQETFRQKFTRKVKENPLVPAGLIVTIGALSYGLYQMKTGDRAMSQKMMRLRVGAQAFTVAALLGGIVFQAQKHRNTAEKPVKT